MQFIDRKFLLMYSSDSFAAASPAGMASFCFLAFFFGSANYSNSFIAQYIGAKMNLKVGSCIWQGIYFSLFSWIIILPLYFLAPLIFKLAGHPIAVQLQEVIYFRVLILGSGFVLLNATLSAFFVGRGKTNTIMLIRFTTLLINVPLDYAMIFGKFGMPEMGIKGAGIATIISTAITTIILSLLIFQNKYNKKYATYSNYKFNPQIFKRLLKYGAPNGLQFFIDIFAFSFFLLMAGRLGKNALAASNAAWTLHHLAFLPTIGFAITVSTIVGQEIGRGRIDVAKKALNNMFIMVLSYMGIASMCFLVIPKTLLWILFSGAPINNIENIQNLSVHIMRYIAFFLLFNSISIIYCSAIKTAGDTKFVMWVSLIFSIIIIIIPGYLFSTIWPIPVSNLWGLVTTYITMMAIIFFLRYKQGHWEKISIINKY